MDSSASLVLEDGSIFSGETFGSEENSPSGEVVFNTSMTGYQEVLTDPSYAGQIVVQTYPLVGNYGINERDYESRKIQVSGFVVREVCDYPSHTLSTSTLGDFLSSQDIAGISGIDTRALARRIRTSGVMMGAIATGENPEASLARLRDEPRYGAIDFVSQVSTAKPYLWNGPLGTEKAKCRIIVGDCGLKYNILRILRSKRCEVLVVPATMSAQNILARKPDGVVISPGPGDPELLDYLTESARGLLGKVPLLGICLGNQILARALGGRNFKLKFGHRGGNHPVRDEQTGQVHITAQNHGYSVDPDSLPPEIEITHTNLHDGTVEGLRHKSIPAMSIQYHPEASPGPLDSTHVFDQFLALVEKGCP